MRSRANLDTRVRSRFGCRGRLELCGKLACFLGDRAVIFIARRVEEPPRLRVAEPTNELRLAHHCLTAALDDSLQKPLGVFMGLRVRR